ncbi:hypothetical protein I4U23_012017 [Adineta vaga]|nr:hypothetical protein I4U23_012017 [Adineta vaga]
MAYLSLFVIALLASFTHARTLGDSSCGSHLDKLDTCSATISFSGECYSSKIDLKDTEYAKCTTNAFFWSYPVNNMTLVIETKFTQQRQPYSINLDNTQLKGAILHVYRVFNNQETEITTQDKVLVQRSDSNYQVILKFQAPTQLSRYGVQIDYKSTSLF